MDLIRPLRRIVSAPQEVARLRDRIADLDRELAAEREEKERERYAARHDVLTRLPNRLYLTEHASRFLATPQPAAAMMDLNGFKLVNDELGHAVGDAVLVEFAARVTAQLGRRWLVVRLGGDEFAALREGPIDEPALVAEATALASAVAAPMPVGRRWLELGCSVGLVVAYVPVSLSVLLARADAALYRSKAVGGRPVMWQPQQDGDAVPRADDRPALRTRDLRRERFGGRSVLVAFDADLPPTSPVVGRARATAGVP
jgi:diguanylate cyclase (GGDEF)-like protein